MKKTIFLFLATLLLTACSKDTASQPAPDILPPITTSGANTAGCIINGKLIISKNGNNSKSGSTV